MTLRPALLTLLIALVPTAEASADTDSTVDVAALPRDDGPGMALPRSGGPRDGAFGGEEPEPTHLGSESHSAAASPDGVIATATIDLQESGRRALRAGRTHEAVEALESAVAAAPNDAEPRYRLGLALCDHVDAVGLLEKMGVAKRLRRSFEEAVELDPAHVGARIALIEFHRQAPEIVGGDPDLVHLHADELIALRPVEGRLALARMLWKYDERRAAERNVRHVLGEHPDSREARLLLATMQVDIGRHEEAIAILGGLLGSDAKDPAAAFQLNRALALSGRPLD